MSALEKPDEELMRDFQQGDREAFEVLYRRYRAPIYSFLLRQYAQRAEASELTQEVFLRVLRGAASFRHGSRFATWIFAIARNLAIDALRKAGHRQCASLDQESSEEGPPLGERIANGQADAERETTQRRLRADIARALEKLPSEQREVFLLREYHGLPFQEIAEVVQAKEGTVKSRMRYALEALRSELSQHEDYARTLP